MDQRQDPDDFSISLDKRRARLAENVEVIPDERVEDNMLQGMLSDHGDVRRTSNRGPTWGLRDTQSTMHRAYFDDLSRKGKPKAAGLGAVMPAHHIPPPV